MDLEGLIRRVPATRSRCSCMRSRRLRSEWTLPRERQYLRRLAHGLRLEASVVLRVHQCLGEGHA